MSKADADPLSDVQKVLLSAVRSALISRESCNYHM